MSRYRQAREAVESETVDAGRAGRSMRKLQLNSNKQRRQSDEAQLAREESASLLPRLASHENTGKRELRYVQFRLIASMQSFSVCLNDELADVTLTQAEVTGLNLSLEQSQPDTGLRADPELDGGSSMKQQTMQVRGTVGGITVYDTHTFTSTHSYSPHSPQSAGHRPSSINPAHFGASSVLSLVPPRAATRVFFKHRSSDLALLTFSFTMQPQPVQHDVHPALDDHRTPVHRGYDASLNLRLSSISAVISHDFFGPLIAYASEGLLKQATDKAAQQARKAIDTIKEDLESRSYLFKYVVAVDNPLVFFPHTAGATAHSQRRASWSPDSFSSSPRRQSAIDPAQLSDAAPAAPTEYLVLDLGRISVYNDFIMSDAEHSLVIPPTAAQSQQLPFVTRAPMERINLSLAAVNLLRASRAATANSAAAPSPHLLSHPLYSSSSVLPPAPLSAPAAHFSRRSASHDTLHEMRADFSVYGDGLPIQPISHVSSSTAEAAAALSDAGQFWRSAVKRKLLEDMDIQVKLVTPLGELRYVGLAAKAVEGDISTVHVNVNERIYAFLLSMYVHDVAPLLALADKPSAAASTAQPPTAMFDGGASIMEEQWGTEQEGQQPGAFKPLSSISEEKQEPDERPAAVASASSVDDISVDLSFREIFIDVQLSPDTAEVNHMQRSSSPFGNVHAGESASSVSHFFLLDPTPVSAPAPFAHIRASTLHIVGRLRMDSSTGSTVGSEFQCSVAKLSVQDSRAECAHPLFRQIVGGHKDDVSLSTAARNRRRSTTTVFTTPASSVPATPAAASTSSVLASPSLHPQALSVDWSSVSPHISGQAGSPAPLSSRPFPSQFLLTPVIPKSPTRSPLPVYHRLSASLQSHSLHTPLPPTILPDLVISGRQDGSGEMSVDVEFTAPRLVLSPGCLTAILHLSDVMNEITDRILTAAANTQPAEWEDMSRSASASSSFHRVDPASTFHANGNSHGTAQTTSHVPPSAPAYTAPPLSVPAAAPSAKPIHVHVAIRDPQIWLMADATERDSSSSHLTHSSTNLYHSAAQRITVVERASRRRLNLAESHGDKSPGTAELTSDDELDEHEDEDDEEMDDEKEVKERPSRVQAAPKSLSCIVIRGQVEVNATIAGDNVQADVDMTELQALICYRAHHLRLARLALPPVPIFEPIHLNIDYSAQPDPDAVKGSIPPLLPIEHIVISLSSLDACFSFLQISTAASILHAIVRVLPPELLFSSLTPVPSPTDPSVMIVPPTFKGSMQLQTAGIELAIVNDAPGYYVPLMRFELSPVALSYTEGMPPPLSASVQREVNQPPIIRQSSSRFSWPFSSNSSDAATPQCHSAAPASQSDAPPKVNSAMTVSLKATIAGSVYNSDIQRWEVFFGPWSIHVSGDDSNIAVTSADMFALTITPSCIHTLARGVESFQTHFLPTITALLASSDEALNTSVDDIDRAATPPRGTSAFSSPAASRKGSLLSPAAVDRHGAGGMLHQPSAANSSADKASYFIVRNETGMRLQFWSVQDSGAVVGSRSREREKQAQTLESGEERTVEMRQYIGVGSGGSDAGRRWLYRSPALGLCVEAGNNSGRWDGWRPIEHISLAAAEETSSKPPVAALLSLNEERKGEESVAGLTVHRLSALRNEGSETPSHQRQFSTDLPSSLLSSFSSLTSPAASTHDLSLLMPPTPSSAADSVVDTWLACRLVAGPDAEGSSARVLVVSSTLLAFNRTFLDLDLQLFDTTKGQAISATLLPSGQSVSLPVLCVPSKQVRLRVRPSGGAGAGPGRQWHWCDNGPRLSYVKQKAYRHTTVRCTIEPGEGNERRQTDKHHHFFARVNVFRSTPSPVTNVDTFSSSTAAQSVPFASSPAADDGVYTIAFDPPLAYKNMLGCELDYMLTVKHKPASMAAHNLDITALQPSVTYTGTLPHKQEVHWYALDLGVTSSCMVQISIRRSLALTSQPLPPSSVTSVVGDSRLTDNDQRLLSPFHHSWSTEWSPHVVIHSTMRAPNCRVQPSVPLKDRHGQILDVALDYSDLSSSPVDSARVYPFAGAGPGLVTSFVPYWLFNCTGLPLVYGSVIKYFKYDTEMCAGQMEDEIERRAAVLREKEDALHADATAEHWFTMAVSHVGGVSYTGWHPSLWQKPYEQQPFLLSDEQIAMRFMDDGDEGTAKENNRRASIRLPNTDWSKPFSVDAVGTHGAIELEEKLPSSHPARPCRMYEFGVSVSLHPNIRFHRTKTILIHPRVLLFNATTLPLQYRQVGTNECVSVSVYEQVAVHRFDSSKKGRLSLRIHAYGWQWSARHYGVAVGEVGSRCMRVRNTSTQQVAVLRLDTRLVQATFEVTVSMAWQDEQHEHPPRQAASLEEVISSSQLVGRTVSAPYFDHQPESSTPSTPSPVSPISPMYLHPRPTAPLTSSGLLHRSATAHPSPPDPRQRQAFASPEDSATRSRLASSSPGADNVPYRLENRSQHTLVYYQADEEYLSARIQPHSSVLYAWDEPDGNKELIIAVVDAMTLMEEAGIGYGYESNRKRSKPRVIGRFSLDRIVKYPAVLLPPDRQDGQEKQLTVSVFADGRVRVLRLSDSAAAMEALADEAASALSLSVRIRLAGLSLSLVSHAMPAAGGSSGLVLHRDPVSHELYHVLDQSVARAGRLEPPISRQELIYLQVSSVDIRVRQSKERLGVDAAVGSIQIDNQLHSAVFPVIFCPIVMKKDVGSLSSSSSFLAFSVVKSLDKSRDDVLFLPHLSIRVQKMQLNVEEQLVSHLLHLATLVTPAFTSSPSSSASAAVTSSKLSGRTVLSSSIGHANAHVSSDLAVSSSQLLTAQRKKAKRAGKTGVAGSSLYAGSSIRHSDSFRREWDSSDSISDLRSRQHSSADPSSALQLSGSVRRRTTLRPSSSSSSLTSVSSAQQLRLTLPPSDPLVLCLQELTVYPIQINVSYSASASLSSDTAFSPHSHPLRFLLRALNVTILNIDAAPLRLSSLHLHDVFSSPSQLADRIRWHFLLQLSTGFYSLLGSSDLLGNPVGLFTSISSGIQSFFYEPVAGLTESPQAFSLGVIKGTVGLIQHSLYGVTNTARGIMSSLAKGLTSLSQSGSGVSGSRSAARRRERQSLTRSGSGSSSSYAALRLLWSLHSSSVGLLSHTARTGLSFVSSAVDLVSSTADSISHAVNPQAKATRIRPPALFELGLIDRRRLKSESDTRAMDAFIQHYLREHANQLYYCCVTSELAKNDELAAGKAAKARSKDTVVSVVLLTTRLLVLYSRPTTSSSSSAPPAPVLMHDLALSDLISVRQSASDPHTTTLWYEQPVQSAGSAADKHTVQQVSLSLALPPHLLQLLHAVISVNHAQQQMNE